MGLDQEQIDAIYRERVLRARSMSPEAKMLDGPRLFAMACRITKDGIRADHPEADEEEVLRILRERLALREQMEAAR
jgi:hypothetical protein